ncbi:MAG: transposase [Spirochaetia bacterium]|jgi:predicted metal-dependent phosphoesterase TrpH|nr:transposase [Spirochaetia bacterium]
MSKFLIDTHVHTAEISPCGRIEARTVVSMYKEAGYDGIIITDHFSNYYPVMRSTLSWKEKVDTFFMGYDLAEAHGNVCGLTVLPGLELTFDNDPNDYLVYGISKSWLYEHEDIIAENIEYFAGLISNTNALIVQAHPYRPGMRPRKPPHIHGIEVYNGNQRHDSGNEKALKHAEHYSLIQTSGSDFHQAEDCARGGMELKQAISTIDEFIDILKKDKPNLIQT